MTWTVRECRRVSVPRWFLCRAVTFGNARYRAWINQVLLACVSLLIIGVVATSAVADSTTYRGPGLYKNGMKVADVEEVTSSALDTPAGKSAPSGGKGREFRRQVLGQESKPSSVEHRRYVYHVIRCRDLVRQVSFGEESASTMPSEIEQMLGLEDSLIVADQDLLAFFERITVSLRDNGYPAEKQHRHAKMVEQHQVAADRLVELLAVLRTTYAADDRIGLESTLRELQQYFVDNIFQLEPRPLSAQPLPLQKQVQPAPVREFSAQPAPVNYPSGMRTGPDPADLDATIDVQFTDEIISLATELNHSPVEIYSYVRENFEFEAYLGSRKGSQETLGHVRGNDYDQASLLIALLRVSGIPARYATGVVSMPTDRAKNWLGIEHAGNAGSILTTAGMEGVIILMGQDTVAIECKRVWVEAWLPYTNYRGAINDSTGFMWVPLDPTFKQYDYQLGINLPAEIGFDGEAFVWDYIMSGMQPEPPVEVFKQMLLDSLAAHYPGATYDDLITTRSVIRETDGILPGTLPYELLSLDVVYSEIPSNKRYQIQFHVYGGGTDLSYSTSLPEIVGKQVTISYVGATPEDEYTIDTAGGIFEVDLPYLVDLKPVLKIDGCEVARGSGAVMMGETQNSDMHFTQPTGAQNQMPTVSNTITAGNYQGIGIDTEDAFPAFFGQVPTSCDEEMLGQEQHQLALTYLNACNMADDDLADLLHLVVINDVAEAIVENSVSVTYSGGHPQTMDWTGMIVDADRKIVGPFSVGGEHTDCDFMRVGGAAGSIEENRLFEARFEEEAISAVKILEIAVDSGITVCEITYNIDVQCPGFNHSASVRSAVQAAINIGHHVIIPQRSFTYGEWNGTGYIDIDPVTCAAGYIIAGGHNGGATVWTWFDPWFLWFWGTKCMGASGNVSVAPYSPDAWYCSSSWEAWIFTVPTQHYYKQNSEGGCYVWRTESDVLYLVPWRIWFIAMVWGTGEYEFTAGGNGSPCSGCNSVTKTVGIASVSFPSGGVSVCKDATKVVVVTVSPSNAPVEFEVADEGIATASWSRPHLTITGKASGSTTVIARIGGQQCGGSIGVSVAEVQFPTEAFWVCAGSSGSMDITGVPDGTSIEYKSDNESIATAAGGPSSVTVQGKQAGSTTIRAFVNGEECGTKDVSVIELAIDGLVNGDGGRTIADMQDLSDPANILARSYVKFQASHGSTGSSGNLYYKWTASDGNFVSTAAGYGSTYLEVKWEAPTSHQRTINVMFEVKETAGGPTLCSETVQVRTVRPYVVRVKFVGTKEQPIWEAGDPEYDDIANNNYPICYVGGNAMRVQGDLAGDKGNDSKNLLAKPTPILVSVTAVYGGNSNIFSTGLADPSTGHWAVLDYTDVDMTSSNLLPAIVREYEDFELHWIFEVQNAAGSWVVAYQEESGYSQKTVHVQTEGMLWWTKKYGLYVTYDDYEFAWPWDFSKHILDYACSWADGQSTEETIITGLLNNGFVAHYWWLFDCNLLASDLKRLCMTLGVPATLHFWGTSFYPNGYWESKRATVSVGEMRIMKTHPIDPVGWRHGTDNYLWGFHQFAYAGGKTRDPSSNAHTHNGTWGSYEDALLKEYQRKTATGPFPWDINQPGQSSGCEPHGVHISNDPDQFHDWRGPNW